jgi:hypothetical protein
MTFHWAAGKFCFNFKGLFKFGKTFFSILMTFYVSSSVNVAATATYKDNFIIAACGT